MKKRNKKTPALKSLEEVNDVLYKIASLTLDVEKKQNKMNQEILRVKNSYEPGIEEMNRSISLSEKMIDEFLKANKKCFEEKRSQELTYGRVGYRSGKNSLKVLNKKFNWEFVKEKFLNLFSGKYVETKITLNKNKILADAAKGILSAEQLAATGCKMTRGESTFYELNLEEVKKEIPSE